MLKGHLPLESISSLKSLEFESNASHTSRHQQAIPHRRTSRRPSMSTLLWDPMMSIAVDLKGVYNNRRKETRLQTDMATVKDNQRRRQSICKAASTSLIGHHDIRSKRS